MNDLKSLRIEISNRVLEGRRLETIASDYWDQTRELQKEFWLKERGLAIGDFVEIINGDHLEKGRLTGMKIQYSEAKPIVMKLKKDGTAGQREHYIWHDTKLTKIAPLPV